MFPHWQNPSTFLEKSHTQTRFATPNHFCDYRAYTVDQQPYPAAFTNGALDVNLGAPTRDIHDPEPFRQRSSARQFVRQR